MGCSECVMVLSEGNLEVLDAEVSSLDPEYGCEKDRRGQSRLKSF